MTQETLLKAAAAPVFERIRRDKNRVGERVLKLMDVLEEHLFSVDCNVNFLKLKAGIRDNSVVIQFHSDLGITPKNYLQECRLETAARLLGDTKLKIWQIGELLGFSTIGVFSRAFAVWAGKRPSVYRKSHAYSTNGECSFGTNLSIPTREYLENAICGRLDPPEAQQLIEHLQKLYPVEEAAGLAI